MADSEDIIVVDKLTKTYRGGVQAVKGISFTVKRSEIFGFLGPNGAGKSTTISMLTTLFPPTSGRAIVAGHDITRDPDAVRRSIGYVSQDIAVDETMTGRENLYLQGRFYHLTALQIKEREAEVLDMVDLTERAGDLVSTYSGGMRKRLDIAEGLIHRPKILFLDEPTLGLDIQTRARIWEYVNKLRDEAGITVFVSTHYMDEADRLCDRVAIIDHGEIKALGPPSELKTHVGGDLVSLQIPVSKGTGREDVAALLKKLQPVRKVTVNSDGDRYDIFNLIVDEGETAVPLLIEALRDDGRRVNALTIKRPSLDDVFLHYTGRELREDEGGEAFKRTSVALRRARHG